MQNGKTTAPGSAGNIAHEASDAAKLAWTFLSRLGKRLRNEGNNDNVDQRSYDKD